MHNLKEIRKDFPGFEKALEKRSLKIDFKKLQKLDEENRNLIQKKENLKHYVSKKAMNIEGLGEKQIEKFIELEIINNSQLRIGGLIFAILGFAIIYYMKNNIQILKRLYSDYSKNYIGKIFLSGICSLIVAGSTSGILWP